MSKLFLSVLLRYFLRHNKPEATCQGNGFPLAQPPVLHLILLSIRFDLVLYAYYAYYAYNGYLSVMLFTSAIALSLSLSMTAALIASAITIISSSFAPRVVIAGVPRRIPLVTNGDFGSFGMVFLLAVI